MSSLFSFLTSLVELFFGTGNVKDDKQGVLMIFVDKVVKLIVDLSKS